MQLMDKSIEFGFERYTFLRFARWGNGHLNPIRFLIQTESVQRKVARFVTKLVFVFATTT